MCVLYHEPVNMSTVNMHKQKHKCLYIVTIDIALSPWYTMYNKTRKAVISMTPKEIRELIDENRRLKREVCRLRKSVKCYKWGCK